MFKRLVRIALNSAAAAGGAVVGANAGQDAYDYVASGRAGRDVKKGIKKLKEATANAPATLPRPQRTSGILAGLVDVPCPNCEWPILAPAGEAHVLATCTECKVKSMLSTVGLTATTNG